MELDLISRLIVKNETKIIFIVLDGLGGIPCAKGLTALEAAKTPNLDRLASEGMVGLHEPIGPGITPGSGPSHLALFGLDPLKFEVGRGVLSALGISFDLKDGDIAARGNFCSLDKDEKITDRRAGRLSSDENRRICEILRGIRIPGAQIFIQTIKEYRFLLVLRGESLDAHVSDTDPQMTGIPPFLANAKSSTSSLTAELVQSFVSKARERLRDESVANGILLRGFSKKPKWPKFPETFGLRSMGLAYYPMYLGLCRLLGMDTEDTGSIEASCERVRKLRDEYDFIYVHMKETDKAGEDGDFDLKVQAINRFDELLPKVMEARPDVVIITGDHSAPAFMQAHSWHPVPVLLWGQNVRSDRVSTFGERECLRGSLGPRFPAKELMTMALAHAGRLKKFGA